MGALLVCALAGCDSTASASDAAIDATGAEVGSVDASASDARSSDVAADTAAPTDLGVPPSPEANVLLVIADDFGVEESPCHAVGRSFAPMPTLRAICDRGVVFNNAWSAPTCSPTRATILTGRYGFRTGVGAQIVNDASAALPLSERTLPSIMAAARPGARAAACVGKWHLSNASNGGADHPAMAGFSRFAGLLTGQLPDYSRWPRTVNGVTATSVRYATSAQVDDARDWLATQSGPWFLWLAFNAPHAPFHLPPLELHGYDRLDGVALPTRPSDHYHAMIEAMDTELARLLSGLSAEVLARTWIVFVGDNGTPRMVVQSPVVAAHAKDTLYQGGIHVPLVIAGPGVVGGGRSVDALVHTVDLFSTILEWSGVDVSAALSGVRVDSVSLRPYLARSDAPAQRSWVYSELFGGPTAGDSSGRTARDDSFKLIRFERGVSELYDLRVDPQETRDLLAAGPLSAEAEMHRAALDAAITELLASR